MIVLTPDLEAQKREQEKKAQFEALVKRANSEDPIAAFKLAHYYYKKQEFIKASIYLREAAIQGHVGAMYELCMSLQECMKLVKVYLQVMSQLKNGIGRL